MSNPAFKGLSRRQCLQAGLAGLAGLTSVAQAQGRPAYDVAPWAGPLSALDLLDTQGKTWRAADLKGRAVLLNFWASWCEPCRAEMPSLQTVADIYGPEKLLVLAINFKEVPSRAIRFAQGAGVTLPVLLDREGKLAAQWQVKVFPTTFLINSRGQPRQRVRGELDWSGKDAEKLISALF